MQRRKVPNLEVCSRTARVRGVAWIGAVLLVASAPAQAPANAADESLRAWLMVRGEPIQWSKFLPYRGALGDAFACVEPFQGAMREFAGGTAPQLADAAVAGLFDAVRQQRQTFVSIHAWLPWLLLVAKGRPDDVRAQFCLVEAWGAAPDGVRDAGEAKVALDRVRAAVVDRGATAVAALAEFAVELAPYGRSDDAGEWLTAQLDVAAEVLSERGSLSAGWLALQRLGELEQEFAAGVRGDGRRDLLDVVRAMQRVSPNDPSYDLLYALVAGSVREREASATSQRKAFAERWKMLPATGPISRGSVAEAMQRLGVDRRAKQLGVDATDASRLAAAVEKATKNGLFPSFGKLEAKISSATAQRQAFARQLADLQNNRERLIARRNELERRLRGKQGQEERDLRQQLTGCRSDISKADSDIQKKQRDIDGKQAEIDALEAEKRRVREFSLGS